MIKTGKIFKESSNIYQDEAKVLFSYYQKYAEKIVAEEERLEKEIESLEKDKKTVEDSLSGFWNIIINFILFRTGRLKKQLQAIVDKIKATQDEHANIFRDYKVNKLGVAYVPVADQIRYEDKSFIVDYSGNVGESKLTLQMPRQKELLGSTIQDVVKLAAEVPLVETSKEAESVDTNKYSLSIQELKQGDYMGKMDRDLRTISYCMSDLETTSVDLPLVSNNGEYIKYLDEFSTNEIPEDAKIIKVFNKEKYQRSVSKFQELNQLKDSLSNETDHFEQVLQSLMSTLAGTVQTISQTKLATTNKLINRSNAILYQILKSPYNHYSPLLEADEIRRIKDENFDYSDNVQGYEPFNLKESSRVRYNIFGGTWVAEDGSTVPIPFGVHQIYEEIVAPIVQNLMAENRIERLKIYNHIHDQKVSYVNKWHQDVDAFYRSNHAESADIINNMQKTLSEYVEAYNVLTQLQNTIKSMENEESLDATIVKAEDKSEDALAAFELQAEEFRKVQDEFVDFMDRLQDDISAKAEEFGHVEYYDARLRDGYSNKMAVASSEVSDLDNRRKQLAISNPLLAKESQLPPKPSVEDVTFEQLSLNLPSMSKSALEELRNMEISDEKVEDEKPSQPETEVPVSETAETEGPEAEAPEQELAEEPEQELAEEPEQTTIDEEPEQELAEEPEQATNEEEPEEESGEKSEEESEEEESEEEEEEDESDDEEEEEEEESDDDEDEDEDKENK